ncbi:MAG: choice-of-anchor J domain-containing protein [candidate division WOR-3 bacterium]
MQKVIIVLIGLFVLVNLYAYPVYLNLSESKPENLRAGDNQISEVLIPRKPLSAKPFTRTVLFFEDFSSTTFPPTDWDTIQTNNGINGYPGYWHRTEVAQYVRTEPASAGIWWSYGHQDEWLITPEITLTGSPTNNYYLRWWFYGFCGSPDSDHYYTKISTDGGNSWTVLYDLSEQTGGWNRYDEPVEIDLSAYADSTILIAWHADDPPAGNGMTYCWFIDDIEIGYPYANDMAVTNLLEIQTIPVVVNDLDTFKIRVRNSGTNAQANVQVMMTADGIPVDSVLVSVPAMSCLDTILCWMPTSSGEVTLKFFTQLSTDENPANDTLTRQITVCPEYHTAPYYKDFNEDWGPFGNNPPFCGWQIIDNGNENPKRWNRNDWFHVYLAYPSRSCAGVRYSPRELQDEWLISPRIDCSVDTQYTLSYWHQYDGYRGANPDTGYVLLSTDGGNTWTEITKYAGGVSQTISYGYKTHNITPLVAGQPNVKIAFRYFAEFATRWLVDDFNVMYTPTFDAMPIAINAPDTILLGDTFDITVKVINSGISTLSPNWFVYLQIRNTKDSFAITNPLNANDTVEITFEKYLTEQDTYTVTVWTAHPDDGYPLNDVLTRRLRVTGWVRKQDILTQVSGKGVKDGGSLVVYADTIYAFRGGNSQEFYAYDPTTDNWFPRKPIPWEMKPDGVTPRKKNVKGGGSLTAYADKIYAFKGGNTREFWCYIPGQDTWIQKAQIPKFYFNSTKPTGVKSGGRLVTHDTVIYAFKGGNTREFWMYIPYSDTWIPRCSLLTSDRKAIKGGSALVARGCTVYAFVGGNTNHFYAYLTGDDVWISRPEPSFDDPYRPKKKKIKDGAALAELDGRIYAFKGGNTKIFGYYGTTGIRDTWYSLEPIVGAKKVKAGGALVAYAGKIYALKGGNTQEFWCYTPNAETIILPYITTSTNVSILSENTKGTTNKFSVVPNLFTKQTCIKYTLAISGKVSIKVYNSMGQLVKNLVDGYHPAGTYTLRLDANNLTKGVYFVRYNLETQEQGEIKLILY